MDNNCDECELVSTLRDRIKHQLAEIEMLRKANGDLERRVMNMVKVPSDES